MGCLNLVITICIEMKWTRSRKVQEDAEEEFAMKKVSRGENSIPAYLDFFTSHGLVIVRDKHMKDSTCSHEGDGIHTVSIKGIHGYHMALSTFGASEGLWRYQVEIVSLGYNGHCRIGWSTARTRVDVPVGFDDQSFALRDIKGTKVSQSKVEEFTRSFGEGDTVHCAIDLNNRTVSFAINDELYAIAFQDIPSSRYFAAISLYKDAVVRVNVCASCAPKHNTEKYQNIVYLPLMDPVDAFIDSELERIWKLKSND